MSRDLRPVGVIDAHVVGSLGAATSFDTLEALVRWPLGMISEVVIQDEYTHDVVVRITSQTARASQTSQTSVFLVFDTT